MVISLLALPLVGVLFMAAVSVSVGAADSKSVAWAAAVQSGSLLALAGIGALCSADVNSGTAAFVIMGGAPRLAVWVGRVLVVAVLSIAVSVVDLGLTWPFARAALDGSDLLRLLLVLFVTGFAVSGFGVALVSFAVRLTDPFTMTNLAAYALTVLCGVVAPLSTLPPWLAVLARAFPLTEGVIATRDIFQGTEGDLYRTLLVEIGVALVWLMVGEFLWARSVRAVRVRGSLELW